ncbi:hypothetical protein Q9L58_004047 [Maublancomyces gigas]|uniref:Uncharacterized protein n=1 Tax=Discina gigas TaxID=1032678 RepID=A0ABR3GM06_9PEZI
MVAHSIRERHEAKRIHVEWCKLTGVQAGSKDDIGMEGAFFVTMRGCTVGGISAGYSASLTPAGFLALTGSNVLPKNVLRREIINDKGKVSSLAKLLVCLQVLWMVVQCGSHLVVSLPVTLLEYHVVIQVGYTTAIYHFWWMKPKDVNEPIEVVQLCDIPEKDLSTYVTMQSQSKRCIPDQIVITAFNGQTDALLSTLLGIPSSTFHLLA